MITIKKAIDKATDAEIDVSKISIQKHLSPASNSKTPIYRVFLDNTIIKRNNHITVEYACQECQRDNIVALNNIMRKLNRGITRCNTCKNEEDTKRAKQSAFMKAGGKTIDPLATPSKPDMIERLRNDEQCFGNMDDDFKDAYFRKHLTPEEFKRLAQKMVSFQHDKFTNLDDFEYRASVKVANQSMFAPYMYDKKRDVLEKLIYIRYHCECCNEIFENRDAYIQKNKYKVMCQECNFSNNVFKIRHFKNCQGQTILYQSKLELTLIKKCNEQDIIIQNGPTVPYILNGKERKYKIDFVIPAFHLLIECKDNHHWHKENIASGKWQAKERAAMELVASGQYKAFKIIYPKNIMQEFKSIVVMHMANKI